MTRLIQILRFRREVLFIILGLLCKLDAPALQAEPDYTFEGTVNFVRPISDSELELELISGKHNDAVRVANFTGKTPILSSYVRVTGSGPLIDEQGTPAMTVYGMDKIQLLAGSILPFAKNVAELNLLGTGRQHIECVARLEGLVLAVSGETITLQDNTGIIFVEIKRHGRFAAPGDEVILEGNGILEGDHLQLGTLPVVENDDLHSMTEQSGTIYLKEGKHPFQLSWFNWMIPYGLEVYYQGPGLPRQKIPDTVLFCPETNANGVTSWFNGLNYQCYGGTWLRVPDFDQLIPIKSGRAANFDLQVLPFPNFAGMKFNGEIQIFHDGVYTFSTDSDDGSLFYVDEQPVSIEITGTRSLPPPASVFPGQNLRVNQDIRWVQTEGTVTFIGEKGRGYELELTSETGRMHVELMDRSGISPELLLNSRIRVTGIGLATLTPDGENVAGLLKVPGNDQIELLEEPATEWISHQTIPIAKLAGLETLWSPAAIVHAAGRIRIQPEGKVFLEDETGTIQLEMNRGIRAKNGQFVELLGQLARVDSKLAIHCVFWRSLAANNPAEESGTLPVLNAIGQIKRLTREQWQLNHPVKVRGVVTAVLDSGFFIQDSSGSIYARWNAPTDKDTPRIGDLWEIEGVTFAEFAPNIQVSHARFLGRGFLPIPLHPTWDQLINGSLDTEYIEVQGIVTAVEPGGAVTLLTRSGKITIQLPDVQPQLLSGYLDSLIRIRGCIYPIRDVRTQQVEIGQIEMLNTSIEVDEAAPANPFSAPLEHTSDLLLFAPNAGALQRVKIAGQIVQERNGEYFLMDGHDGLRFIPKEKISLEPGDVVQVVGFPELGGPSPVLREAVIRVLGKAPLPSPQTLPPDELFARRYDSTLVRVRAYLTSVNWYQSEQVMELQAGSRSFMARLKTKNGWLPELRPGTLLTLTGVYDGQGGDLESGREIDGFDLLLNSVNDVSVLKRPSWWTVQHTLTVFGAMAMAIVVSTVWITLLRRQVEERSIQLAAEVSRREHIEHQREFEKERTRIARDLHDDLGSELTAIGMLAMPGRKIEAAMATDRLQEIAEKSRSLISALDGVVWVTNPQNDTLASLVEYLAAYTEEFLAHAEIACRIEVPKMDPGRTIVAEVRHDVLLAVRESLNNAVRHGHPTEVLLRFSLSLNGLEILIQDNGRGFDINNGTPGNGLVNLRERMKNLGGECRINSLPMKGTTVILQLPLVN